MCWSCGTPPSTVSDWLPRQILRAADRSRALPRATSLQETASTDGHSVRASVPNRPSTDATSVQNLFGCMVLNIEFGSRNGRISRGKRAPTVVFRGEAEKGLEREGAVQASQFPQPDFSKYM